VRRFLDSFDYTDSVLGKYTMYGVVQDQMLPELVSGPGPAGRSYRPFNTAFSACLWTRIMSTQQTWYARFHLKPVGSAFYEGVILRFENQPPFLETDVNDTRFPSNGALLTVTLESTGQLKFWLPGGPGFGLGIASNLGNLVGGTTGGTLALGHVTYVEIRAVFGPHGSLDVRFDDVAVMSQANMALSPAAVYPDRISRYFAGLGGPTLVWDNYDLCDGQPGPDGQVQDFDGPSRITAHFPVVGDNLWNRHGASKDVECLQDNPSDGDTTYIEAQGITDYFGLPIIPCYGLILSAAANVTARRKTAGANTKVALGIKPQPGAPTSLGDYDLGDAYSVVQGTPLDYSLLHPPARMTAGEVQSAAWGLGTTAAPGVVRATQFFVEVLTSLRAQRYSCGQGSYSF
jgi:hypothetical protein